MHGFELGKVRCSAQSNTKVASNKLNSDKPLNLYMPLFIVVLTAEMVFCFETWNC
jgi:hypothetical protein